MRLLTAAAAASVAALAGCGGGSTTTVTVTRTVSHTRTVTVSAVGTTTVATGPCLASALTGAFAAVPGSAGAGQITYRLRLTNQGDSTCKLSGVPSVVLLDSNGAKLPTNVQPARPDVAGSAVISPGAAAIADARFSPDVPGTGDASGPECEDKAYTLRVTVGSGSVDAPITPPTPVCERGSLVFASFSAAT